MATAHNAYNSKRVFRGIAIGFALLLPFTIFGFWKTYFSILGNLPETVTTLVHVHAASMMLWLLMLIAQAYFVWTDKRQLHRLVGRSSFVIVPLIVVIGLATLHEALNRTPDGVPVEGGTGSRLSVLGFGQMFAFALSWMLAMVYRRRTAIHVRFIISTVFGIATAIVFRVFLLWIPAFGNLETAVIGNGSTLVLLLLVLIGVDWRLGIRRSPYWVIAIVILIMHLGYWTFATSNGWHAFCQWFADLG